MDTPLNTLPNPTEQVDGSVGRKNHVLFFCYSLFIACLLISSITASKLYSFSVFGFDIVIPIGTELFALTFLCTDVIAEIWGPRYSMNLVFMGFLSRVLMLLFFYFAIYVEPVPFWTNQEAYSSILGGSEMIIIAGIVAYLISQTNDVFVFHYFREKDKGKNLLWKRNNLSTFLSQFLDSFVFVIFAFAATLEASQIISIIVGQVIVKWAIAIIDTPFIYMLRNYALGRSLLDFRG